MSWVETDGRRSCWKDGGSWWAGCGSHGVGVLETLRVALCGSLGCTERTMVLNFSGRSQHTISGARRRGARTKVQDVAASAGVESQWGVACRAILRLKLADVLPEAGLVGNMAARELQDALAAQSVLEGLLAHSALAADEGAVPARAVALDVQNAGHASRGMREVLRAR